MGVLDDIQAPVLLVAAVFAEARAVARGLGAGPGVLARLEGAVEPPEHAEWFVEAPPEVRAGPTAAGGGYWSLVEVSPRFVLLVTGVGKASAAGAVAHALTLRRFGAVLNLGVAGALPRSRLGLGEAVLGDPSILADEGVQTPERFLDVALMGFAPNAGLAQAPSVSVRPDAALADRLRGLVDRAGGIATVSVCSGRNRLAVKLVERTGAIAECMEGAAVGFTVSRAAAMAGVGVAFAEVRTISNTTGNRARQRWNLGLALERLSRVAGGL
ncbi:MAG: futalosine hydrolase [Phycisphaerales bacterium]|nr:futalosine hydrolase [Phycisphaerales bacterium]